jgi:hypothetical protein
MPLRRPGEAAILRLPINTARATVDGWPRRAMRRQVASRCLFAGDSAFGARASHVLREPLFQTPIRASSIVQAPRVLIEGWIALPRWRQQRAIRAD